MTSSDLNEALLPVVRLQGWHPAGSWRCGRRSGCNDRSRFDGGTVAGGQAAVTASGRKVALWTVIREGRASLPAGRGGHYCSRAAACFRRPRQLFCWLAEAAFTSD